MGNNLLFTELACAGGSRRSIVPIIGSLRFFKFAAMCVRPSHGGCCLSRGSLARARAGGRRSMRTTTTASDAGYPYGAPYGRLINSRMDCGTANFNGIRECVRPRADLRGQVYLAAFSSFCFCFIFTAVHCIICDQICIIISIYKQ